MRTIVDAGELVALEPEVALEHRGGVHERSATAGDDALLDRGAGRRDGVLEAVLALLELGLGVGADLDDADAAGELGEALLELLLVPVGVAVLDLLLDLGDATGDLLGRPAAVDDRRQLLGDRDGAGACRAPRGRPGRA